MASYIEVRGTITDITDFWTTNEEPTGCSQLITVQDRNNSITNFVISPSTYLINHAPIQVGDPIVAFYNGDLPVPLIYPPRYQAVVIGKQSRMSNIYVSHFNDQLISSDGMLRLNLGPNTRIRLTNGQYFLNPIENKDLVVIYGPSTRSIPAITTPDQIIVLCAQ